VAESPRWLFRRGKKDAARAALLRSRTSRTGRSSCRKWKQPAPPKRPGVPQAGAKLRESLLRRKYVIPFLLACVILACNQATGVNSIIGYNATILIQAGLDDKQAHLGYVLFTVVNFLVTMGGVMLVDRKGRKFLLSLGSAGIIVLASSAPDSCFAAQKNSAWIPAPRFNPWSVPIRQSWSVTTRPLRIGLWRPAATPAPAMPPPLAIDLLR
jgi:hypothetical protein